jgi:uncharacterized protein
MRRGEDVLARVELIRASDGVLTLAGELLPMELRPLDAMHLASARLLGADLARVVTSTNGWALPHEGWDGPSLPPA